MYIVDTFGLMGVEKLWIRHGNTATCILEDPVPIVTDILVNLKIVLQFYILLQMSNGNLYITFDRPLSFVQIEIFWHITYKSILEATVALHIFWFWFCTGGSESALFMNANVYLHHRRTLMALEFGIYFAFNYTCF